MWKTKGKKVFSSYLKLLHLKVGYNSAYKTIT